jgi:hypothetical protein
MESKRYYNENPQVSQWKEKCEILQEELDYAIDRLETLACCNVYTEGRLQAVKDKIMKFNRLPWYKKMFFKFEV